MEVFYKPNIKSLVYYGSASTPEHWDQHWQKATQLRHNPFVLKYTRKYLPAGARILEAGCGNGEKVMTLRKKGYQAEGLDWAKATVERLNSTYPNLPILQGDIRALPYSDQSIDGYWSLGVIEHFAEGIESPVKEASRVLKKGGIALVTVPSMSWLRQIKVRRKAYPLAPEIARPDFFQYVYNPDIVIEGFRRHGLELIHSEGLDGVKGLKDEILILNWILKPIYQSHSIPVKVIRRVLQIILSPFTGHIRIYIFRKI